MDQWAMVQRSAMSTQLVEESCTEVWYFKSIEGSMRGSALNLS